METQHGQPIGRAFERFTRWMMVLGALASVLVFAVVSGFAMHDRTDRALIEQARLAAAAIEPDEDGALFESINRLRYWYPSVRSIGLVSRGSRFDMIHPDYPTYREAMTRACASDLDPVASTVDVGQGSQRVWAVTVPLPGDHSRAATRFVVLLSDWAGRRSWAAATAVFGFLAAVIAIALASCLSKWFQCAVAGPLGNLAAGVASTKLPKGNAPSFPAGQWRETRAIANRFDELVLATAESEARAKRVAQRVQERMDNHREDVDRELKRAQNQAMVDELTGAFNRAFLNKRMEKLVGDQRRSCEDLAVVILDVDNFKFHNDTFGHMAGDDILRFVGVLLRGMLRASDHVVRYGGDEFVLLLPGTSMEEAAAVAERVIKLFGQYTNTLGSPKPPSISAGVTSLQEHPRADGKTLIKEADSALYDIKRAGKAAVACR